MLGWMVVLIVALCVISRAVSEAIPLILAHDCADVVPARKVPGVDMNETDLQHGEGWSSAFGPDRRG